ASAFSMPRSPPRSPWCSPRSSRTPWSTPSRRGARTARRLAGDITGAADRAAGLERLVLGRAAAAPPPDPLLRAVVARLRAGGTVGAAAAETGLGVRRLHRRSLAAFGYGAKTLARILRLRRALDLVAAGTPYAVAAHRAGCVDQAHLAREMRALTGMTLTGYTTGQRSA
ncbi:helix-turn-helix domain-containing protein, partial [Streptomyces sp. NPDC046203]|uniref:helix-turn-helix domain-containing protein n=1 Tax=Streptomyces sp. NPDC046203 TaxID=3154602 RepID=UPI0033C70B90